jgi:hypothetical protein
MEFLANTDNPYSYGCAIAKQQISNGISAALSVPKTLATRVLGLMATKATAARECIVQKIENGLQHRLIDKIDQSLAPHLTQLKDVSLKNELTIPPSEDMRKKRRRCTQAVAQTLRRGTEGIAAPHPYLAMLMEEVALKVGPITVKVDEQQAEKEYQLFMETIAPILRKILVKENLLQNLGFALEKLALCIRF